MDIAWLLILSMTCIWFDNQTNAQVSVVASTTVTTAETTTTTTAVTTTTTSGDFILSCKEYEHTRSYSALHYNYKIGTYTLPLGSYSRKQLAYACGIECIAHENCTSFVLIDNNPLCHLSRLDRCIHYSNRLEPYPGYHYYEVHSGENSDASLTCYEKCLSIRSCSSCGFGNCHGYMCSECANYCWERQHLGNGWAALWYPSMRLHHKYCKREWQRVYTSLGDKWSYASPDMPLKMYVAIYNETRQEIARSYFDDFKFDKVRLTVGNYSSGDAKNFWEAPFVDRTRLSFSNSSCMDFFYHPNMTSCEANGLETIFINGTIEDKGFMWITGNSEIDETVIGSIDIYMTKAD